MGEVRDEKVVTGNDKMSALGLEPRYGDLTPKEKADVNSKYNELINPAPVESVPKDPEAPPVTGNASGEGAGEVGTVADPVGPNQDIPTQSPGDDTAPQEGPSEPQESPQAEVTSDDGTAGL